MCMNSYIWDPWEKIYILVPDFHAYIKYFTSMYLLHFSIFEMVSVL